MLDVTDFLDDLAAPFLRVLGAAEDEPARWQHFVR